MWKVYCYQNKLNGKRYIGATNKIKERRAGKQGTDYIKHNQAFGKAIVKYGWDNFEYSILAITEDEFEASLLERFFIKLYNTADKKFGYNRNKGGNIPTKKSIVQYDVNKNKIAEYDSVKEAQEVTGISGTLIIESCKYKNKMAGGFIWRYKIREKEKMDDIYIIPFSGERRVTQLNISGEVIAVYNSAKEAEQKTGAIRSKICMCCKGKRKTAGGYKWEYTDGIGLKDIYNPKPSPVRKIQQFDLEGNLINEFESQKDAHRKTGFSASMIGECCRGIRQTACGYIWKYI